MRSTPARTLAQLAILVLATGPLQAAHPTVELVSRAHPSLVSDSAFGQHGAGFSVSADGRFVAFVSGSPWLVEGYVAGPHYYESQVFLFDRQSAATLLVSHAAGLPLQGANGDSASPQVSADGRWVAYFSSATNLIDGQAGFSYRNVFLYDRLTGTNRLVSHVVGSTVTAAGVSSSTNTLAISAGGERVAFVSSSTQLVPGQLDVQDSDDVFLFEQATGDMRLVSHSDTLPPTAGYLDSRLGGLSADGRRVVFLSQATNLLQGLIDLNSGEDAFLYDLDSSLVAPMTLASGPLFATANSGTGDALVSADGARVMLGSVATNLVAGQVDSNYGQDIFLVDVATGTHTLVSHAAGQPLVAGNQGSGGYPRGLAISGNGQTVAFLSWASDLVSPPANSGQNVYACLDPGPGCALASHDAAGTAVYAEAFGGLSQDGAWLAYSSGYDVTGSGGGNYYEDVYSYDVVGDTTRLVSARGGTPNGAADERSLQPVVSAQGAVVFYSWATNLVEGLSDQNGTPDVYVWDQQSASLVTRRSPSGLSLSAVGGARLADEGCLSADGRRVLFLSTSSGLVPGSRVYDSAAFLFDRSTGVARLVSHEANDPGRGVAVSNARLTTDGSQVLVESESETLVPGQVDTNWSADVFAFESATGAASLVSHAAGSPLVAANSGTFLRHASADGRYVLLASYATDLVPGVTDVNPDLDLYLCDRVAQACALVTHAAASATTTANAGQPYYSNYRAVVSPDGSWVGYESKATDLVAGQVDTNQTPDVFLWERTTGLTVLVSHASGNPATAANDGSGAAVLSDDGSWVSFVSSATDLVPGQAGLGGSNVYLYERATGLATLVSHAAGQTSQGGDRESTSPALSGNGARVAYLSVAHDLVTGQVDNNSYPDVFLFDRSTGENLLVSRQAGTSASAANSWSGAPQVAADGSRVAFISDATNLVIGQVPTWDPYGDVFIFDVAAGTNQLASPQLAAPLAGADGVQGLCASADGGTVTFSSDSDQLVALDRNGRRDVFVYGRSRVKGDLSDDLQTDLVLANRNAPVHRVWTLDGDLNRLAEIDVTPDQTGPDWQLGGVDDFDGDGRDDLVFRNTGTGAVEVWMMNGATRVGAPVPLSGTAPAPEWRLSATADFDHDARPDLLWRNTATRALEVWTMNGAAPTGTITPTPAQAADANWEVVAALDMDRDGNADLVWYNQTSGRIVFWFMDATVQRLSGQFATPMQAGDANWKVLAAGDYGVGPNGRPGTYDLVWRNANSGRFVVWNMDTRGVRTAGRFLNPPAPADPLDWTIAGPR